jgi:transposase
MPMDVLLERVAGLDVHKRSVTACVRTPGSGRQRREDKRTFPTYSGDLGRLRDWLKSEGVTDVAMEATGVFWKPVWHALEGGFGLLLVNARHVKMIPGRKTDVNDAAWLAQLLECGLLRGSFIPPPEIRRLRDLTRYRKRLVQDRTREGQRVEKVLEDAGIKLASVASRTLGVSGRAMIDRLIAGERDPEVLAALALKRLRYRIDDLEQALVGRFDDHHATMLKLHLAHVDQLTTTITDLDQRIDEAMASFTAQRDRLMTIPGVAKTTAEVIIAEVGVDMSRFPTAAHLASWTGLCPGNNESAGKHRSGRTTRGSVWLRDVITQAAWAAARTKDSYLSAQFWRLAGRIGQRKAAVAVAHSIIVAIWHILHDDVDFQDLGADYFVRRLDPERTQRRLVRQLQALGLTVTVEPAA